MFLLKVTEGEPRIMGGASQEENAEYTHLNQTREGERDQELLPPKPLQAIIPPARLHLLEVTSFPKAAPQTGDQALST